MTVHLYRLWRHPPLIPPSLHYNKNSQLLSLRRSIIHRSLVVQTHGSPRHTLVHNTHILEVHNTHILEIHNTHILEVGRCSQCKLSQGETFLEKALEEHTRDVYEHTEVEFLEEVLLE